MGQAIDTMLRHAAVGAAGNSADGGDGGSDTAARHRLMLQHVDAAALPNGPNRSRTRFGHPGENRAASRRTRLDAIALLIGQHRALESKMKELKESTDDARRAALLAEVGDDLTVHLASEEEIFYPAVRARRTEDILLESLEEHLSLKRLLADLLELPVEAKTFAPKFQVLKEQTEHHHKEEEEHLFPKVPAMIDDAERNDLGERMAELQQRLQRGGAPREAVAEQTEQAAPLT